MHRLQVWAEGTPRAGALADDAGDPLRDGAVAAVNGKSAAIEESGEYRVTRSKGWGPGRKIRKVIFRHLDEAPARRFYKRTPAAPGYIIALWRPDGTLIACTNGLARPAS